MTKAIRDHLRDFVAIAVLFAFGLVSTVAILLEQGVSLPSWAPGGKERFELQAELSSAQAVTPGQGQTVNIAGIRVGDITDVELEDGRAVVTMAIDEPYEELVHSDATILLRPRTGLQDMTIELDPGTRGKQIEEGATVPLAQTEPNVNPDQFFASLDADTRDYLVLLLQGGAEGLGDSGEAASATLRRFEPTARDLARINRLLAERQANIRHAITNFKLVSEELGDRDTRLGEFVDSSSAVLGSFARQQESIRAALRELPGALVETRGALESSGRLALELGPASRKLIPSARALGPALEELRPFFRRTLAPIRDQIRPFTTQIRPSIEELNRTSDALREATPELVDSLGEVNRLFNGLAYDPPGVAEGNLFWIAWLNHNNNSIFTMQDAHGPLPRGIFLQTCATASNSEGLIAEPDREFLRTVQNIARVVASDDVCP